MERNDALYINLQRHLDRQAVGFPATKSGAEIRILKHIFSPDEAKIATCLTYKLEPIEMIFERARHWVESPEKLKAMLEQIEQKGGIETKIKDGTKHYGNAPLLVGMYEYQLNNLTPAFIKDFDEYTADKKFGLAFLSTKLPQMRTIPIAKSIQPQHHVSTFDEITVLMQQAEAPFAILECICRKKAALSGAPCHITDCKETCLSIGHFAQAALRNGAGREITLDEGMSIIEQNQKEGLVLQPSNTQKAEFICSCCGCCCGMLGMHKILPKPVDFWVSNFYAVIDKTLCEGCGNCEKRCPVGAVRVSGKARQCAVDRNRCIGCGVCVPACPNSAISLERKPAEVRPPQTREDLNDIFMAHKKGAFGKLKVTGKLLLDVIRTGHTQLLK